jgi:hypothetical protein
MSLPLHQACIRDPPSIIISALISACPSTASVKCDGNLPLHLALKHGAVFDVIQVLILAYPEGLKVSDASRKTPEIIFNENKENWNDAETRASILNVLKGGVGNIDLNSNKEKGSVTTDEKAKYTSTDKVAVHDTQDLATSLNEEGWKKVRCHCCLQNSNSIQ